MKVLKATRWSDHEEDAKRIQIVMIQKEDRFVVFNNVGETDKKVINSRECMTLESAEREFEQRCELTGLRAVKILWNKTMEIGMPDQDAEHKELVELVNQFVDVLEGTIPMTGLPAILKKFTILSKTHMDNEEKMMAHYDYPNLQEHREAHEYLFESFKEKLLNATTKPKLKDAIQFVWQNLRNHLVLYDKEYAEYIQKFDSIKIHADID